MNIPFNSIKAFALQASGATRRFVLDGYSVGKGLVQDGSMARQMAIKAGIGAGAGAAAGVGISYASDDRHAVRDGVLGGVAGGLLGAGWAARKSAPTAWKSIRGTGSAGAGATARVFNETNAMHGPSELFERGEQPGGLRNGWEKAEAATADMRSTRYNAGTNAMSGIGNVSTLPGQLDRKSSYGYNALPKRYQLSRDR